MIIGNHYERRVEGSIHVTVSHSHHCTRLDYLTHQDLIRTPPYYLVRSASSRLLTLSRLILPASFDCLEITLECTSSYQVVRP